jgi:hypothetical protein
MYLPLPNTFWRIIPFHKSICFFLTYNLLFLHPAIIALAQKIMPLRICELPVLFHNFKGTSGNFMAACGMQHISVSLITSLVTLVA